MNPEHRPTCSFPLLAGECVWVDGFPATRLGVLVVSRSARTLASMLQLTPLGPSVLEPHLGKRTTAGEDNSGRTGSRVGRRVGQSSMEGGGQLRGDGQSSGYITGETGTKYILLFQEKIARRTWGWDDGLEGVGG